MSGTGDRAATHTVQVERPRGPVVTQRRARLKVAHIDPWSATKLSFVLSIAFGIVFLVAVALLWFVLDSLGVFRPVANVLHDFTQDSQGNGFDLLGYVGFGRVMSLTLLVACVNVVLITLLGAIASVLFNLATSFTGGLQVTLSEDSLS